VLLSLRYTSKYFQDDNSYLCTYSMIYTDPCVMLLMWAASITRAIGWVLGPRKRDVFVPLAWHGADRRVPFGDQITRDR
jgi:hypothetical protein